MVLSLSVISVIIKEMLTIAKFSKVRLLSFFFEKIIVLIETHN